MNGLYSYTRAAYTEENSSNDGNQLIYVPVNMGNASIRTGYRNSYAGISAIFTGKRFTTVDNDRFLPGYTVTNIFIGYKASAGSNSFDLSIKAENIFNEGYEIIAYYPMPGRSFLLSFTYQFNK